MSTESVVILIVAILGSSVVTAGITLWVTRRKTAAETREIGARAASEEIDTTRDTTDLIKKMQGEQVDLYRKNTELEKANTDQTRTIEILTGRLNERDGQLAANAKQMELLRNLAKDAPIVETLQTQLDAVRGVVKTLEAALSSGQHIMQEKERTIQELTRTNSDLALRKPPRE